MVSGLLSAVTIAVVLTWAGLRWLAPRAARLRLVDRPGGRKRHCTPTPTVGGLGIAVGIFAALALTSAGLPHVPAFLASSALLTVVGALDDVYDLHWVHRILAQVAASLIMVAWGGVRVHYVGDLGLPFAVATPWISLPLTVIATVGLINAVNMCDGSDGLAGLLCAACLSMLVCAALYAGNLGVLSTLLPMLGAVAVFLYYNVRRRGQPRARIFLGNAGSMLLGFAIAQEIFRLTQNPAHPVSPVLALWLFIPPVLDCLVLIARRLRMGHSPFTADRGHMHHLLLDAGFSPAHVALKLMTLQLALGLLGAVLLRLDAVKEWHLLAAFGLLGVAYYALTARRGRAVRFYARFAHLFERGAVPSAMASELLAGELAADAAASGRTHDIDGAVDGHSTPRSVDSPSARSS